MYFCQFHLFRPRRDFVHNVVFGMAGTGPGAHCKLVWHAGQEMLLWRQWQRGSGVAATSLFQPKRSTVSPDGSFFLAVPVLGPAHCRCHLLIAFAVASIERRRKMLAMLGALVLALVFWPLRASSGFRNHW